MLKDGKLRRKEISPARMVFAIIMSVAMLVAMLPNMAPAPMFAGNPAEGAQMSAEDTATPEYNAASAAPEYSAANRAPKIENGDGAATGESEPASLFSVSFILPEGYLYGDGENIFTVRVAEGDSVSKTSIPIVPASEDDIFTGWLTVSDGKKLYMSAEQIAARPVTADVEYTAAFENISAASKSDDTKAKGARDVSPQATDWAVTSGQSKLSGTTGNVRLVDPNGATGDYTNLKTAVEYMAANGNGGTWLMYVKGTESTSGVDFKALQGKVGTLVITGDAGDPAPTTPTPAQTAPSGGYLSTTTTLNFACNVQLRNIRYQSDNIYMNGNSLTLGHQSWAQGAANYFGGAASGTISGNPVITVWSTGTGASLISGGMYAGTLNGNTTIYINNTSNNSVNVYGGGFGENNTANATNGRAYLNGSATTTITGMGTAGGGLSTFFGGVQYGNVTGRITNTVSGPGRWNNNARRDQQAWNNSGYFVGGARIGDIGTDATKPAYTPVGTDGYRKKASGGTTIITNNVDISRWTYGQGTFIGTLWASGTVKGNIHNTLKAADYNKGSFSAVSGGAGAGGSGYGFNSASWNNTYSISRDSPSNTKSLTIGKIQEAEVAAENAAHLKQYGNIYTEEKSGCMQAEWAWERFSRGGGYGFVMGDTTMIAGTEGLCYSEELTDGRSKYSYGPKISNYNDNTAYELIGGGGWPGNDSSFYQNGDTLLDMHEVVAGWTYGGSYGCCHIGDTKAVLRAGIVDTLEGDSRDALVHIGDSRAEIRGGQVDWFLSGGGWDNHYKKGNTSVEVFEAPKIGDQIMPIINASIAGDYGQGTNNVTDGNVDVTVRGGDFSGRARDLPYQGFSTAPSNGGYILGDATMTLDFRGNTSGFKITSDTHYAYWEDRVSAARRYNAGGNVYLGASDANTITLNIFADAGAGGALDDLDIYGDARADYQANTRSGKITMNINAPGANLGKLYATNYNNVSGNKLTHDVEMNVVSAHNIAGLMPGSPSDNITNTVAGATVNKAVLNIGPQPEPPGWDSRPISAGGKGAWPLADLEPNRDSDGFPKRIFVTADGIKNFTSATIDNRLLIAKSGGILNGSGANATNHRTTYNSFGDMTLKDGAGLGVESGNFIAGKLTLEGQGYVASPGSKNQITFSDIDFAKPSAVLTWLRTPYTGTGSVNAATGMNTNWFGLGTAWPVITLNTGGSTSTQGKTNVEKLTPANFNGQDIAGGKTYIGDTDTHFDSGDPDRYSGYGVCVAGAFYNWKVVAGGDGVSLGKVRYDVVNASGVSAPGTVTVGTSKPTSGSLDVYGTVNRNTDTVSGAIAIPSSKNLYAKLSFIPDATSGEWTKDLTVGRSDRYEALENPPNQSGKGRYDYHEFEQSISDYNDAGKRTRTWAATASGRKTGSYQTPPVYGTLPSGQDDRDYSFDITVDYTKEPELSATSVILKEDAARALVAQANSTAKSDADIVAAIRSTSVTNVKGRPFLTDDIVANDSDNVVTNDAFHALSTPLDMGAGEYTRTFPVTYYTHSVDSNAISGATVTMSKTVNILVVPNNAEVTTGAALVASDADMLVKDAKGIAAQNGNATAKKNIDHWTGAKVFAITPAGGIEEKEPTLTDRAAKVAAFGAVSGKAEIPLTYSYNAAATGGGTVSKAVKARIVGARVDGTLWVDANGNGTIDANEADRFIGKNVKLYKKDASGGTNDVLLDSTVTDGYGRYSFGAYSDAQSPVQIAEIPEGDLYIIFPDLSGYGMTTHSSARRHDFHVDYSTDGQYDFRGIGDFNGGYKWPDITGLADSFSKEVYDASANGGAGAYVSDMKVTDSGTVLQYRLQFTLPSDIAGYSSLTVRDIMPAGLAYAGSEQDAFIIRIGGTNPADGTAYAVNSADIVSGQLAGDPSRSQVAYNIVDFTNLAGKTVNVYIKAKLVQTAGKYPDRIENRGQLILNAAGMNGSELLASDPLPSGGLVTGGAVDKSVSGSAIGNGASVTGILWNDEDGDGIIGGSETARFAGEAVALYAATDSAFSNPLATATTDANGEFKIEKLAGGQPVPEGSYVIKYPEINNYGYITIDASAQDQGAASIKTNVKSDNGASHVIVLDLNTNQRKVSNAGYKLSDVTPPEIKFTEYPLVLNQTPDVSHVIYATDSALKAGMEVTDDRDNPTWEASDATDSELFVTRTALISLTQSGTPATGIDTQNIGVYKATYRATDEEGNETTATRAIVVTDGRYAIDPNDNGGIIIGARNFVAMKKDVTGDRDQARDWSFAEAFDIDGNALSAPTWKAVPRGKTSGDAYAAHATIDEYDFEWTVPGYVTMKKITGQVTGATYVDPGSKDSQYALIASDFQRNAVDAQAMLDTGDINGQLITAANAQAIALVAGAPAKTPSVRSNGNFSAAIGSYNIEFVVLGTTLEVYTVGVVSNGFAPILSVPTPIQIEKGGTFTTFAGITAQDIEDGNITPKVTAAAVGSAVDTNVEGAFTVMYSVTDSDHNTVTNSGIVLVGAWSVVSGYGIIAHDFAKSVGDVQGTDDEIITESAAKAVDLRRTLSGAGENPNFGKYVPVKVMSGAGASGYRAKTPAAHDITIAVDDQTNPDSDQIMMGIVATIGSGANPVIEFTAEPLEIALTPSASNVLTAGAMKAEMRVTDAEDYPAWEAATGPQQALFKNVSIVITKDGSGVNQIDTKDVGVYKLVYTATDSHGNTATASRALVVNDGRYIIDPTDNGGIIIGARSFAAKSAEVDGSVSQVRSWSWARAYTMLGDELSGLAWSSVPQGKDTGDAYVSRATADEYEFEWTVSGYNATKTITGIITNASDIDNGGESSQYALIASDFRRNTTDARAMVAGNLDAELIGAAKVQVIKLVAGVPDLAPRVLLYGSAQTGMFSETANTYPLRFGAVGVPESALSVGANGVVSDGNAPILVVDTPVEVSRGGIFATFAGIRAHDNEDGDITSGVALTAPVPVVDTNSVGRYHLVYTVTDRDHNTATAERMVVVNDGTYVVNPNRDGRILKASSFVTRLTDVASDGALLNDEILGKSGTALYDGTTGAEVDDTYVHNSGGYNRVVGEYSITVAGVDLKASGGALKKPIVGKVVDADVMAGPAGPDQNGAVYYAYGKNIQMTVGEAATLDTDEKLLNALGAHTDKVLPGGVITDGGVRIKSITGPAASPNLFGTAVGTYYVTIADVANPENVTAVLTVSVATGAAPVLTLHPMPLVYEVTSAATYLTTAQIMSGATATDAEDDADQNKITTVTYTGITTSGQAVNSIPAGKAGVYQVVYKATDSDGNEDVRSRAVVVNDNSIKIEPNYMIQAKSFIIGKSAVDTSAASAQLMGESEAMAWDIDGNAATAYVKELAGYGSTTLISYFPKVAVTAQPSLDKTIEARVVDDETAYNNGEVYSLIAKGFRINLPEAHTLAAKLGSDYQEEFIRRALAAAYDRTGSNLIDIANSVRLDGAVVKKDAPNQSADFSTGGFANGDVYLATFSVVSEPDTKVTVEILVSNANPPQLDVPACKVVNVGDPFPNGAYGDASPSYMQKVSASDIEDGPISASAISHDSPVGTSAEGAFTVKYSVTDSDHNTVTKSGVVLVGAWSVVSGYGIIAHDFTKSVGDVQGTDDEIVSESAAKAIDLRQTLTGGGAHPTPNPNYGKAVPVKVASGAGASGYRAKNTGNHDIIIEVNDQANPDSSQITISITATIGAGDAPTIIFTEAPLVITQSAVSHVMDEMEIKAKMQVTDPEDYPIWEASTGPQQALFKNPVAGQSNGTSYKIKQGGDAGSQVSYIDTRNIGVYRVYYTTIDRHGNKVENSRAIVVTDGRYIIDPNDDIIIGARDFVIARDDVDGSESQAKGRSYAEAFNITGDQLPISWTAAPANYAAKAPVGEYMFTWKADGHSKTKTIKGTVTGAPVVDPGTKDSQYALIASGFTKTTVQARAMVGSGNIDAALIQAAGAQVIKLVDTAPNAQVGVVNNGDASTGPFSDAPNAYPIRFGVAGLGINELKALVTGTVAEGSAPTLIVTSPLEIWIGAQGDKPAWAIEATQWTADRLYGVSASDAEDGDASNGHDITSTVTSEAILADVDTAKPGIYRVAYSVTDSDGNRASKRRTVVVNDGTYTVGKSRVLEAHSFEVLARSVATQPALKDAQIKGLSGVVLYDGVTGDVIDDTAVRDDDGYMNVADDYNIIMGGRDSDEPSGWVTKQIVGKVVDNTVIVGPEGPDAGGYTYYVRGDDITITPSRAQTLTSDAAVLNALNAIAEKISPSGQISNAGAVVFSITPNTGLSSGNVGVYRVEVRDTAGNAQASFSIWVTAGDAPTIDAPEPIVLKADPNAGGNADRGEIMQGVTADDSEDGDITEDIVINPDANGAENFPNIPLNVEGVYQVKFFVTDSDGNQAEVKRAVVVDGGSYIYDKDYILQARSFIIGVSEVAPTATEPSVKGQILNASGAKAWDTKGATAAAIVDSTGSYKAQKGDYFPVISIRGHSGISKQIQAMVVDDSITHPKNGEQYSIEANDFRINLLAANALKAQYGSAAYADAFKTLANATSYIRTGTQLAKSGSAELVLSSVVNKDGSGTSFEQSNFVNGNVYYFTARFRVAEEPATFIDIDVTVSNASVPVLTVPAQKIVPIGAAFDNDTTLPSYMSGVSASDIEDGNLPVTHDGSLPLDTTTRAAFNVTYSVTDSDSNTVTKQGVILVGEWSVIDGYAITANDFTKRVGQVSGTAAEAIGYALADAIDVRPTVGGRDNPNFGAHVAVTVTDFDGYDSAVGEYNITYAVAEHQAAAIVKKATVVTGNAPILNVPDIKRIDKGQFFDENTTNPSYMSGVSASDFEDGDITVAVAHDSAVAPGTEGAYVVTYSVTDSDRNTATKAGIVLVGPWGIGRDYAILAHDFSRTLGQVTGSNAEIISSSGAQAICINPANPNYGKAGTVTVANNGGYRKAVGDYNITLSVVEDSTAQIGVKATVGTGRAPTINVPAYKQAALGSAFGDAQYMSGVSASDPEDGDITSRVAFDRIVNTGIEGYYTIGYSVTDSDGNTAYSSSIVFVGSWTVGNDYAINAHDFSKRLAQVTGTVAEMTGSAGAQAVCIGRGNPSYGRAVAVTVTDDDGYSSKRTGSFRIVIAVQADLSVAKAITATVTLDSPPTLTVPAMRRVSIGAGVGYMQGVSASDPEDGDITHNVIHDTPVNTNASGAYLVSYSVTDSDGNIARKSGIVLVGSDWVVRDGYAIYAEDFARKLSQITGTKSEAIRLAKAQAVWIADQTSGNYGNYVTVTVKNTGGYKKKAGNYDLEFAVAEATSVTIKARASISDDSPKAPLVSKVENNTSTTETWTTPAPQVPVPQVTVNAPQIATTPSEVLVEAPVQQTETSVEEQPVATSWSATPSGAVDRGAWHLVDLILAIGAIVLGLWLMVNAIRRKDDDDIKSASRGDLVRRWGQLGVLLSVASVALLLFTQRFDGDCRVIDLWSIIFAVIFGAQLLATIGINKSKNDEWDEDRSL